MKLSDRVIRGGVVFEYLGSFPRGVRNFSSYFDSDDLLSVSDLIEVSDKEGVVSLSAILTSVQQVFTLCA